MNSDRTENEQFLLDRLQIALDNVSISRNSYESRLKLMEAIFKCITQEPAGSFRRLIYCRLGFNPDAYAPLYLAGGMEITNALSDA